MLAVLVLVLLVLLVLVLLVLLLLVLLLLVLVHAAAGGGGVPGGWWLVGGGRGQRRSSVVVVVVVVVVDLLNLETLEASLVSIKTSGAVRVALGLSLPLSDLTFREDKGKKTVYSFGYVMWAVTALQEPDCFNLAAMDALRTAPGTGCL